MRFRSGSSRLERRDESIHHGVCLFGCVMSERRSVAMDDDLLPFFILSMIVYSVTRRCDRDDRVVRQ